LWRAFFLVLVAIVAAMPARAHDIPNARVDRSTQVSLTPGRIRVDYGVSLTELTLTQELRSLIGHLPGGDRSDWFAAYGHETGPLNAKGFLVTVSGEEVPLQVVGFDLVVEEHPRFTFHFQASLADSGRLRVQDTNFVSSEGTSRLAVRGAGVTVRGDTLPADVESITARPKWQLSDAEETRTRLVEVEFATRSTAVSRPEVTDSTTKPSGLKRRADGVGSARSSRGLSSLLDRASGLSLTVISLLAFGLGAVHALQPGHGKTLVVATVLGDRGGVARAVALAAVTTVVHTGSVFLVAVALWWTSTLRFGEVHVALTRTAGYLMAAVGCWRVGRHLGGFPEHAGTHAAGRSAQSLLALGFAGGIVPCWDAIGLVVLAEAVGQLGLALGLVIAFGLGLGVVLAAVGWFTERFRRKVAGGGDGRWPHRFGLASGLVLAALGVYLFTRPAR
jgi:nickel/cobalt transporter (NicO) family protein